MISKKISGVITSDACCVRTDFRGCGLQGDTDADVLQGFLDSPFHFADDKDSDAEKYSTSYGIKMANTKHNVNNVVRHSLNPTSLPPLEK